MDEKVKKCPICHKELTDLQYRPFCSKRCADIDLGNWFNGSYRYEAQTLDEKDLSELDKLSDSDMQ
ncbi:MAG: DNA gyrase inhibitor YacG [Alphaproteobacteria bacterium]|nr:DNA gyrase inhibitor YacG [Alphaproteobacteria bacterium]